jgi:hypothetical protein
VRYHRPFLGGSSSPGTRTRAPRAVTIDANLLWRCTYRIVTHRRMYSISEQCRSAVSVADMRFIVTWLGLATRRVCCVKSFVLSTVGIMVMLVLVPDGHWHNYSRKFRVPSTSTSILEAPTWALHPFRNSKFFGELLYASGTP